MAESINTSELSETTTYQSSARKRFEKFRAKLVELFFNTDNTTTITTTPINMITPVLSETLATPSPVKYLHQKRRKSSSSTNGSTSNHSHNLDSNSIQSPTSFKSNNTLISNCYYGYKTIDDSNTEIRNYKKSKNANNSNNTKAKSNNNTVGIIKSFSSASTSTDSSSQSSQSSSSEIDSINSPKTKIPGQVKAKARNNNDSFFPMPPSGTIMIDSISTNYDSFSLSTNNTFDFSQLNTNESSSSGTTAENSDNPFFNPAFTQLISFNSDLSLIESYFEASMHLIDDQDNFFDIDFMTNYISYILFKRIKNSSLLHDLAYDLKVLEEDTHDDSLNLLKKISRDIFLQSETEPCGLKGCKLSIYLEEAEKSNHLLSQFRFDSTSSLTTFELQLILKKNNFNTGLIVNNNINSKVSNFPFATLTRRLLNRTQNNASSTTKSNDPIEQMSSTNKCLFLDSNNYVMNKLKLY